MESSAQLAVQQNAPSGRRSKSQTREGRSESSFPVDPSHPARYSAGKLLGLILQKPPSNLLLAGMHSFFWYHI